MRLESLGLFVRPSFLAEPECVRVVEAMRAGPRLKGTITADSGAERLDEEVRKVSCADPGRESARAVYDALSGLRPDMESHFKQPLGDLEGPVFLVYGPGAFYTPHRDVGPHNQARRTSVVVFLNGGYAGGALTLYGLLEGPKWSNFPVRVAPRPGLLVAFPSDTLHEVQPVETGQRCTAVAWFSARP